MPDARAVHREGYSTGTKGGVNVEQPISPHYFRSRNFYLRKHHGRLGHFVFDFAWLSGAIAYAIRCMVTSKPADAAWQRVRDFWCHRGRTERLM